MFPQQLLQKQTRELFRFGYHTVFSILPSRRVEFHLNNNLSFLPWGAILLKFLPHHKIG